MQLRYLLMGAGALFTVIMVAGSKAFPLGQLNELSSASEIYRFARTRSLPAVVLAYAGYAGLGLRDSLAAAAAEVPDGLFVAVKLEGLLDVIPGDAFQAAAVPELAQGGMETIALAFNRQGERRRWTNAAGAEAQELLLDPDSQAQALVAFMQT
jgi:hypothetical protein